VSFEEIRHIACEVGWWKRSDEGDMLRWLSSAVTLESMALVFEYGDDAEAEAELLMSQATISIISPYHVLLSSVHPNLRLRQSSPKVPYPFNP
jgi:hypothetical protein